MCGVAVPAVAMTLWSASLTTGNRSAALMQPWLFSWLGGVAFAAPPGPPAPPAPPIPIDETLPESEGWFGIGLRCSDCSMSRDDSTGARVWHFRSAPEIMWIDPDSPAAKAGVERGDAIVKVAGLAITTREAGRRFGAVKPGESMQWTVENDGKERTVTLVAAERPDRDLASEDMERQLRDARQQLDQAKRHLHEQLREMELDRHGPGRRNLESALDQLEATHREIERMMREHRTPHAWGVQDIPEPPEGPEPPPAPEAARPRQNMRYEANVGDWHVEVRSTGEVGVSENHDRSEIIIKTPDSTIRVRKNR
jgi:hypothetical protein